MGTRSIFTFHTSEISSKARAEYSQAPGKGGVKEHSFTDWQFFNDEKEEPVDIQFVAHSRIYPRTS
jgi:hypothetical protein